MADKNNLTQKEYQKRRWRKESSRLSRII